MKLKKLNGLALLLLRWAGLDPHDKQSPREDPATRSVSESVRPMFGAALHSFAVAALLVFFALITAILDVFIDSLERAQISPNVIWWLRAAEYVLLAMDLALLLGILWRGAVQIWKSL